MRRRILRAVPEYAVTAIGRDRPGIVAAISSALLDFGGNIEGSQMTMLGGQFAVMLVVSVDDGTPEEELAARLGGVRDELELQALTFTPVEEAAAALPRATHTLRVQGRDRPGMIATTSAVLAGHGVNIIDLESRLEQAGDEPRSVVLLEIDLSDCDRDEVEAALREAATAIDLEVSLSARSGE
jgi:glycine cleavage system transcriptional repressor